ncbi:MarR family winged helix-turn-helix transcriptional regulator [Amycolatopsis taiwanensis]|uniref:Transcriptional regulator n=1 Tax=Amycolatopsis taiwanensis TaxID=342230 RepID=A0A9W6R774_9PSEU|nr:MarR family transcriptional regulator [Amycolatopsis taiwanensis]GLY68710.1 transcriptional regulator [Amycolatopsis taiwanensis]
MAKNRRIDRAEREPDLGMLAARLLWPIEEELFARLAECGHEQVRPRHGALLAYLDEIGTRPTELARITGQHKQVVGRVLDELEDLGYARREPDPTDRRSKLVVLTERGRDEQVQADRILADIEARHEARIGTGRYRHFRTLLQELVQPTRNTHGP